MGDAMKLLRSITRRGFQVGTAGYFTVLKPNTWFPASRLPVPFRYRAGQSPTATAETTAPNIISLPPEQRSPLRVAIIVLASTAIVFAMLMWIMHPNF
jgi:hypothetical protein